MFIAALSVNHKIAPVAVREKLAFSEADIPNANTQLNNFTTINASVILSTCNRLEIYVASNQANTKDDLIQFLLEFHNIDNLDIEKYIDYFAEIDAVNHICKVAAGIDSLVMGEPQILGQLKTAYHLSKQNNTLNSLLEKLFQHSFLVAKKIRTQTEIGKNPVSVAYCGIKLSEKIFNTLVGKTALLIGAGEMIELSVQHLKNKNIGNIIIANRTKTNAEKLTNQYGGKAIALNQISDYIHKADIVITSTAAPIAIIGKGLIESAMKKRKHNAMFMLDIAVPRDVESEIAQIDGVYLYTVDDLNQVIDKNIKSRTNAKDLAIKMIESENDKFINYLISIPHNNLIKQYHQNVESIKQELLTETLQKIDDEDAKNLIIKLADQLTNRLLHSNFTNIKQNNTNIDKCSKCLPN